MPPPPGHNEVAEQFGKDPREYSISTKEFQRDAEGNLTGIKTVRVEWTKDDKGMLGLSPPPRSQFPDQAIYLSGAWKMAEVEGSEQVYPAQMVLLALGFLGPETAIVKELGLDQDARGNIKADTRSYKTSMGKVYACGDARRGQSLIVWVRRCLRTASDSRPAY